jgi:hypothetical protein
MPVLSIQQVDEEGYALEDIVKLIIKESDWQRLLNIPIAVAGEVTPNICLIDCLEDSGHTFIDNEPSTIKVSPYHAEWYLKEICLQPKSVWGKIRRERP